MFNIVEKKIYSQNGEDGVIEFLSENFKKINFFVEIGVQETESNCLYLKEKNIDGLFIDSESKVEWIKNEFVTRENILFVLEKYKTPKKFEFLSIDIDYNTYWILKSIIESKIYEIDFICVEYNGELGFEETLVVPYDDKLTWDESTFYGASLKAYQTLLNEYGYNLFYCENNGVNAFFVKNDLVENVIGIDLLYKKIHIKHKNSDKKYFDSEYYNHLKVYDCEKKIRIGNKFDGGYVIADIANDKYDCYISAGVGEDESFSEELTKKYNLNLDDCFSFDNTIEKKPKNYPVGMKHVSLNISETNNLFETNLLDYFTNKKNVFLKMDIEGGELTWLSFVDKTILSKIKQMVIEFHNLDTNKDEIIEILKKINETHYLIHTHANNYAHIKNLIPSVIELTFLRKTEFKNEPGLNTNVLPSSIDYPNNKETVDIDLNYEPFVFKKDFIKNKIKLFEFYGLRRSGLHAVVNWILCNFTDCKNLKDFGNHFLYSKDVLFIDNYYDEINEDILLVLNIVKPKIIIILYEDKDLNFSVLSELNLNISEKNKFTIYRSLENTIASRLKFNEKNTDFELPLDDIIFNQWVENVNYHNTICYENWLLDKTYRDEISQKFKVENKDIINNVSYNGGGSSFIGVDLDSKENLLNRYKMVEVDDKILEKIKYTKSKIKLK